MKRLALAAALMLTVVACAGSAEVSGDRRNVGSVTVAFSVRPARVEPRRPVRLTLRLTNNAGKATMLEFASGQQYDFWITDGDEEVWRWSEGQFFTQALQSTELGPQESISFIETWDAEGTGTFTAFASVLAEGFERSLQGEVTVGDDA